MYRNIKIEKFDDSAWDQDNRSRTFVLYRLYDERGEAILRVWDVNPEDTEYQNFIGRITFPKMSIIGGFLLGRMPFGDPLKFIISDARIAFSTYYELTRGAEFNKLI